MKYKADNKIECFNADHFIWRQAKREEERSEEKHTCVIVSFPFFTLDGDAKCRKLGLGVGAKDGAGI